MQHQSEQIERLERERDELLLEVRKLRAFRRQVVDAVSAADDAMN